MRPHDEHRCTIPGDEIRSVRDHWAFSRTDLAEVFGVTPGTIYAWERRGVTCRNQKFNQALFRVLKLSRDVLQENGRAEKRSRKKGPSK